jgi:parvulin-like peptidyl-prolyl isomerase
MAKLSECVGKYPERQDHPTGRRRLRRLALAAGAVLALTATVNAQDLIDGVAAIVNDKVITFSEVRDYVQPVVQELRRDYEGKELYGKVREAQLDALNNLIERNLILQEFNDKGYNIPSTVVDEQLNDQIANEFGGDRAAFIKTLEAQHITLSQYRDKLREQIIVQAMRNRKTEDEVVVSPYKIEKYYKEHQDDYKVGDEIKLRMIFIKKGDLVPEPVSTTNASPPAAGVPAPATDQTASTSETISTNQVAETNAVASAASPAQTNAVASTNLAASANEAAATNQPIASGEPSSTNQVAETNAVASASPLVQTNAVASTNQPAATPPPTPVHMVDPRREMGEEIVAKLDAGASFDSMARVYSEGREGKEGGDWGWIGHDVLRKELNDIAFSLKPGQHSQLIVTDEGYYILQVDDVNPSHTRPLSEVRDDIEKILLEQQRAKMQQEWVKELRTKAYIQMF